MLLNGANCNGVQEKPRGLVREKARASTRAGKGSPTQLDLRSPETAPAAEDANRPP